MPFWLVVLAALIGVPCLLMFTGMGMIFWVGGLAGGPQESRAQGIVHGWFAFAWVLASVFGAFGLAPAWRAWHGGGENFDGGLQTFIDWLVGVGIVAALLASALRPRATADRASRSPLVAVLRGLLLALGFLPWAALAGWIVWPLVLWPAVGRFEWPDAATGWRRTGAITLALLAAMAVEQAVRRWRRR
jgi:hypothetical protein